MRTQQRENETAISKGEGKDEDEAEEKKEEQIKSVAQDAAISFQKSVAEKTALAQKLSPVVGTFDHSAMYSPEDVAAYAVKKLGLKVKSGGEVAAISGYLAAFKPATAASVAMDSKQGSSVNKFAEQLNKL